MKTIKKYFECEIYLNLPQRSIISKYVGIVEFV